MKRLLIFLILFLNTDIFAFDFKEVTADYTVSYGVFGEVAKAHASLKVLDGTYKIKIVAEGTGLAKLLSRGRVEVFESTGIVQDNKLLPHLFVQEKTWGEKQYKRRYFFHHDTKTIEVQKTQRVGAEQAASKETLGYYAKNDILTIFFNLKSLIGEALQPPNPLQLKAVGANKDNGILSVKTPQGKKKEEIKNLLDKDKHLLIAILHQKLFSSQQGELFLNINDEGICDKVILKDVVMFGDLLGSIQNVTIKR